jgi:hypothetical protein
VVSFTICPLYRKGKRLRYPLIGGCVSPRAGLDYVENTKFLILPRLKLRPFYNPAHSRLLYRLSLEAILILISVTGRKHKYHNNHNTFTFSPRDSAISIAVFRSAWKFIPFQWWSILLSFLSGTRGNVVAKALYYRPKVAGSRPD